MTKRIRITKELPTTSVADDKYDDMHVWLRNKGYTKSYKAIVSSNEFGAYCAKFKGIGWNYLFIFNDDVDKFILNEFILRFS